MRHASLLGLGVVLFLSGQALTAGNRCCSAGICELDGHHAFKGECDDALWSKVYNPKRLEIHRCVAVTGTFVDATAGRAKDGCRHEADGDSHCWLKLGPGQEQFINAENIKNQDGNLVFEPMCQWRVTQKDAMQVCKNWKQAIALPVIGSRVRITGVFVTDTQHGHNELHPISHIEVLK